MDAVFIKSREDYMTPAACSWDMRFEGVKKLSGPMQRIEEKSKVPLVDYKALSDAKLHPKSIIAGPRKYDEPMHRFDHVFNGSSTCP